MIIIGTYHKTGTVLFKNIVSSLKKKNYKFINQFNRLSDNQIKNNKCIIIIRNPYEIICSSMRYHQISNESWLHKKYKSSPFYPSENWDMSYQDKINSLKNDDEKIIFEMENSAKNTILSIYHDIKNRNYDNNILIIQLEELYDTNNIKNVCQKIIEHVKDPELNINKLIQIFNIHLKKNYHRTNTKNEYTFIRKFKDFHYTKFNKTFPSDLLEIMNYS